MENIVISFFHKDNKLGSKKAFFESSKSASEWINLIKTIDDNITFKAMGGNDECLFKSPSR